MGRHSAPDEVDDDTVEIESPLAVFDLEDLRGRHAIPEDEAAESEESPADADQNGGDVDEALTQRIAVVDAAPPAPQVPYAGTAAPPAPPMAEPTIDKAAAKAAKQAEKTAEAQRKAEQKAAQKAAQQARKAERGESGTRADLRVLREQPAVRAQVIGAVIASFLIYTLVLLVLGHTDKYLIWLWVPIVVCGVLVGLVLDLAHRRTRKSDDARD
jgi:hypothetical protein